MKQPTLTTWNLVHFVLYEKVNQGHQSAEEQACHDLPVFYGPTVLRTEGKTAKSPRQRRNQIGNHEDIMPVMIIR